MISLTCKVLVALCLGVVSTQATISNVIVECVNKCNIAEGKINGDEGETITLKYIINTTDFVTFDLMYNDIDIIQVAGQTKAIFPKNPHPAFLDMRNVILNNSTAGGYSFSFKVVTLNTTMQDGAFIYSLSTGSGNMTNNLTLNVLSAPKLVGQWVPSYDIPDDGTINVTVAISGNPRPKVTIGLWNTYATLPVHSGDNPYVYTIKFVHVDRRHCGKNVTLDATGYKGSRLSYTANVNVRFVPSTPQILSATVTNGELLKISWAKIESGSCQVTYTLLYDNGANIIRRMTHSQSYEGNLDDLDTSFNATVRVQANVGGRKGQFSTLKEVVFVSGADAVMSKLYIPIIALLILNVHA